MGDKQNLAEPHDAQNRPMDAPPPYSLYPEPMPGKSEEQLTAPACGKEPPPQVMSTPMGAPFVQPTIIQVQTAPPTITALGPESIRITCPYCQADVSTRVDKDPSMAAYISAILLFLVGCVCGCCLIPFCMDSCRTSEHYCPNCKKFIGRYSSG